jgi:TolA-binding protein
LAQKKKVPPKAADSGAASPVLERALKLYDGEDYYSASIELYKVVEGESGDSEPNKQRAEFWMGKALYKLKFYSASLTYFDRIVQKGAAHAHYNETLKWLASLSREVADSAGVLDKIGKYNRAELDQPALETVRDELYFLLGKYNYNKGKFKEAVSLFGAVSPKSEFYVQAKLFEGATHVREYEARPAVESFKEVLRVAAESSDSKVKPFEDLANLSLARTFYSTGQYDLAVKYFDKVSTDSYDWPNSLFEASWANFMLKQAGYSKALGNIHTLQAPYFENFIKPESVAEALTVKATIYFYNCLYDRAEDVIREFNESVPGLGLELKRIVDGHQANDAFFDFAAKIRTGDSGLQPNVERAAKAVLSDRSLARRFEYVQELDRELSQHEKADPAWKSTAVANAVLTDITLQRSLTVNETGELAKQRVSRLFGELQQLARRMLKIEYEILQGQKGQLEQEVIQEQQLQNSGKATEIGNVRVDDEHQYWPFVGEYWRDELGYYRFRLLNRCDKMAPEGAPAGPTGP